MSVIYLKVLLPLQVQRSPEKALVLKEECLPKSSRPALISTIPFSNQLKLKESHNKMCFPSNCGKVLELLQYVKYSQDYLTLTLMNVYNFIFSSTGHRLGAYYYVMAWRLS